MRSFWRARSSAAMLSALLFGSAAFAALAQDFSEACVDPSIGCRRGISAECLRVGAGSVAVDDGADCAAQLQRYSDCLAYVAERCPREEPSGAGGGDIASLEALTPGHRIVAESAFDGWRQLYVDAREPLSWAQAARSAERMGGRLVVIDSAEKNRTLYEVMLRHPGLYQKVNVPPIGLLSVGPFIGLHQLPGSAEPAGGWRWVDGSELGYANWADTQPDNLFLVEHVAHFICAHRPACDTWNDVTSEAHTVHAYIAETPR